MKEMQVDELKEKLKSPELVLIDVREVSEYEAEHIEEALLIPLSVLSKAHLPTEAKVIVFHCAAGVRSQTACHKVMHLVDGVTFYSLAGGINAWKAAGFKTCRPNNTGEK